MLRTLDLKQVDLEQGAYVSRATRAISGPNLSPDLAKVAPCFVAWNLPVHIARVCCTNR